MDLRWGDEAEMPPEIKILIKPEALTFQPVLPLYKLASIKVITDLYRQPNVLEKLQNMTVDLEVVVNKLGDEKWKQFVKRVFLRKPWTDIESFIHTQISRLEIPKMCCYELQAMRKNVSVSLLKWVVHIFSILRATSKANRPLHLDQIVWNQYGKINEEQSARALLTVNQLTHDDKLLIACVYCLEDQVRTLTAGSRIPYYLVNENNLRGADTVIRTPNCADFREIQAQGWPITIYWNAVLNGRSNLHMELINYNNAQDDPPLTLEHYILIECASPHHTCEAAVKYLWSKLNPNDRILAATYIILFTFNLDLGFYFLNNLDFNSRLEVLAKCHVPWLRRWMSHFLWQDYYFTVLDFFIDVITPYNFGNISLFIIVLMINERSQFKYYYGMFRRMWYEIPERIAKEIFSNTYTMSEILYNLRWDEDVDFVKYLLSRIDDSKREDIISSSDGLATCENFLTQAKYKFFDLYTSSMFFTEESLFQFKRLLIRRGNFKLASYLFNGSGGEREKPFFKWYFQVENKSGPRAVESIIENLVSIREYKLLNFYIDFSLPPQCEKYEVLKNMFKHHGFANAERFIDASEHNYTDFLRWFFQNEHKDDKLNVTNLDSFFTSFLLDYPKQVNLDILTYFLNWTVEPTQDLQVTLKDPRFLSILHKVMKIFAEDKSLDLADRLLKWYFAEDTEYIVQFKRELLMNRGLNWATFVLSLIRDSDGEDKMAELRMFVRWGFPNGNDKEFKRFLVDANIWWKLLITYELPLADEFLNFCFDTCSANVTKFKNDAFISRKFELILNSCIYPNDRYNLHKLQGILGWFSPNTDVIIIFKSIYSHAKFIPLIELLNKLFPVS